MNQQNAAAPSLASLLPEGGAVQADSTPQVSQQPPTLNQAVEQAQLEQPQPQAAAAVATPVVDASAR